MAFKVVLFSLPLQMEIGPSVKKSCSFLSSNLSEQKILDSLGFPELSIFCLLNWMCYIQKEQHSLSICLEFLWNNPYLLFLPVNENMILMCQKNSKQKSRPSQSTVAEQMCWKLFWQSCIKNEMSWGRLHMSPYVVARGKMFDSVVINRVQQRILFSPAAKKKPQGKK